MTHTEALNIASQELREAAIRYTRAEDHQRAQAFQALCVAASGFAIERDAFRAWLNSIPSPNRPPASQKGRHT